VLATDAAWCWLCLADLRAPRPTVAQGVTPQPTAAADEQPAVEPAPPPSPRGRHAKRPAGDVPPVAAEGPGEPAARTAGAGPLDGVDIDAMFDRLAAEHGALPVSVPAALQTKGSRILVMLAGTAIVSVVLVGVFALLGALLG